MVLVTSPRHKQLLEKHSPLVLSYVQGDAVPTSAVPTVGEVGNFSSLTSYTAGTAGNLAGTIATDGGITITAGGAWFYCCRSIRLRNHGDRLMTRLQEAVILGLTLGVFHGMMQPARSVPVVPNFTQGSMTTTRKLLPK